jgi:hypothetical protein
MSSTIRSRLLALPPASAAPQRAEPPGANAVSLLRRIADACGCGPRTSLYVGQTCDWWWMIGPICCRACAHGLCAGRREPDGRVQGTMGSRRVGHWAL